MRLLLLALVWPCVALAQNAAQDALDAQRQQLNQDRRTRQAERSQTEQTRTDIAKPPAKDPRICESARVNYQTSCGSAFTPRWNSRRCAEAEVLLRQNC